MTLFGKEKEAEDGYRRTRDGETPDVILNGVPQVQIANKRYSEDDGTFNKGDVGDRHYRRLFNRNDTDKSNRGSNVANNLREAERDATNGSSSNSSAPSAITNQRSGEQDIPSSSPSNSIKNMVKGKNNNGKKKKSLARRAGPIIAIALGLGGYGAMSFIGQMAMPFSLIAQFQSNFDSIGTSTQIRTNSWFKMQANPSSRSLSNEVKDFTKSHSKIYQAFTGNSNDYFKISTRQKAKLAKAGITVETDAGTGQSVLKFTEANGNIMTVVPDENMANGSDRVYINDFYDQNEEFHNAYFSGARTWRGAVGAWYDNICNKFLSYFGVKRGVWAAYKKSLNSDVDMDNFRTGVEQNASSSGINGSAESTKVTEDTKEVPDGEGGTKTETKVNYENSTRSLKVEKGATRAEVAKAANDFISNKVTKLAGTAGSVANAVCMVSDIVGAINLIVMAYQTTQIIKVASSIFEGIQKGQVEDSKTTPLNEIANSLTKKDTSTIEVTDLENTAWGTQEDVATKEETLTKSAMEANAVSALYGGTVANASDPSIQSFNISNSVNGILRSFGSSAAAYKTCAIAKIGAAAVQGAVQIAEIVGCIASFGIGCLFDALFEAGKQIGISVLQGVVASVVISAIVPFFANILMRKIATDVVGEDLGNALVSGANIYMGQNHQYTGGSVGSKESYAKFLAAKDEVERDKAYYARTTLSPFDYTSQYTFMGNLVNKFVIPISLKTSSITSSISTFTNIAGNAVSSLMPGASAVDAGVKAQEAADQTENNCPDIDSIGGVADVFCNPYIITDMGTTNMDPAQVAYKVSQLDSRNFDLSTTDTDTPKIKENSRLGHYILYCGQRQSPFGLADQNIANEFKNASTGSSVGDSIIGAIPVIGSMVDIYNNTNVMYNFGYVSGESCVTGNAVEVKETKHEDGSEEKETSDWSENKYYQRFIEDQRLAENMGIIEKSSVTAFLDDYYEKHPIDQSYEGVLARRSGLTKDQVIATLDVMEAIAFMADYNPDGYAPLNYSEPEAAKISLEDTYLNNINSGTISAIFHYDDADHRRIRNFAV